MPVLVTYCIPVPVRTSNIGALHLVWYHLSCHFAVVVPPLPVPNLGYACLNSTLQAQKPTVTSNRGAILRTFNEKGLVYISQLALQNCKDLLPIVQWNHEHNIRLFRYVPSLGRIILHKAM